MTSWQCWKRPCEAGERHCLVCFHHQPVDIGCAWIAPIGLRNAQALFDIVEGYPQVRALLWGMCTRNGMKCVAACACWPSVDLYPVRGA